VESRSLRLERAARARAVAETLKIRDNAWRWLEAWDRARSIQNNEPARTQLV